MAERLADTLSGLCSLVALLIGAFAVYIYSVSGHELQPTLIIGCGAGLIWAAGRVTKYVMVGR